MPRLPLISGKKLIAVLSKLGYGVVRQRGSHIRLCTSDISARKPLTVPDYRLIDRSLLKKILRDAKLTTAEFIKLLKK
ncbi:MAG: type II toxin-antitoxin system HicA family toxin [Patescibacteria group bacterium]